METNSEGGDASKEARLRRNRASAALSRQRKRLELVHLRRRCVELERAVAHFQYVAQCASAENVDLRRRLVDGVTDEVAGSNPVVVAVNPVTRLPIPRMAPIHSSTTRGRRTGAADWGGRTGGGHRGRRSPWPGNLRADDAAYTLRDMPRGVASTPRATRGVGDRLKGAVPADAGGWRGCDERRGDETRLRATGSVPNAPRRAALPLEPRRLQRTPRRPSGPGAPRARRTPE